MIAAISSTKNIKNIVISTGNILNSSNKLGSKVNEELHDGLEATIKSQDGEIESLIDTPNNKFCVLRATKELHEKLAQNDRPAINIGAKLFLKKNTNTHIDTAVSTLLEILKIKYIDNLVLATLKSFNDSSTLLSSNSENYNYSPKISSSSEASNHNESSQSLNRLWNTLEELAIQKKVLQLGIADIDMETLAELHKVSKIPPTITQINLSSCCKVPDEMQEFCTNHDIQLLTHSDTADVLPDEDFEIPDFTVDWILRYQIHLRCRGVLIAKGYLVGASKMHSSDEYEKA